jgi:hypothetical protein
MSKQAPTTEQTNLNEDQVVDYLRRHATFFIKHDYLLNELTLPHASGKAISLSERQVQVFREHRDALQTQLDELMQAAHENDAHFKTSKHLLLNLLEIKDLNEIEYVVKETFKNDVNIDFSSIVIIGAPTDYPLADLNVVPVSEAQAALGKLMDASKAVCGRFTEAQLQCLFPSHAHEVGSAAIIPLRHGELLGLFCLASKNEAHFNSSMGSLFLSYISDFISRLLPDLLLNARRSLVVEEVPSLLE